MTKTARIAKAATIVRYMKIGALAQAGIRFGDGSEMGWSELVSGLFWFISCPCPNVAVR
jgi:hypothetical protein